MSKRVDFAKTRRLEKPRARRVTRDLAASIPPLAARQSDLQASLDRSPRIQEADSARLAASERADEGFLSRCKAHLNFSGRVTAATSVCWYSLRQFSDLTHYIRGGHFILSPISGSGALDEYAWIPARSIGSYRRTVSGLILKSKRVAWVMKPKDIEQHSTGIARSNFVYETSNGRAENLFAKSSDATLEQYRALLTAAVHNQTRLPDLDLDTDQPALPGIYGLADNHAIYKEVSA